MDDKLLETMSEKELKQVADQLLTEADGAAQKAASRRPAKKPHAAVKTAAPAAHGEKSKTAEENGESVREKTTEEVLNELI